MSREEIERKEKRNKMVLGIILAALMLLSTAGYALLNYQSGNNSQNTDNFGSPNGQVIEYKGVKFVGQESGLWAFQIEGNTFYSSYTPEEVKGIITPYITLQSLAGQTVYYSGDILAISEIISNINPYLLRSQEACLRQTNSSQNDDEKSCEPNLPVKNCDNNFIITEEVEEGETSRITINNKCIIIKSKNTELLKSADALLFRILGIQ